MANSDPFVTLTLSPRGLEHVRFSFDDRVPVRSSLEFLTRVLPTVERLDRQSRIAPRPERRSRRGGR